MQTLLESIMTKTEYISENCLEELVQRDTNTHVRKAEEDEEEGEGQEREGTR